MAKASASPVAGSASTDKPTDNHHNGAFLGLMLGSVGVVFGDIGTSPLYAFREAVTAAKHGGMEANEAVLGVLSLILWTLILIVTAKYVLVLLRADNKGEGGTFALMALGQSVAGKLSPLVLMMGIVGASFFYGDAVLTPAISVLSAVEGLKLVAPELERWVVPISVVILVGLFLVQSRGTAEVGRFFGPITAVWFALMGLGGLIHIVDDLSIFAALSPYYGAKLAITNGLVGLVVLGLVFLAVTGAEALYADLGHFGRRPITFAWFALVFPSLLINYFGQGALVLSHPEKLENPFFLLYPEWALLPMVLMATIATVIASQAVITGAFSLTRQAIQLGLLPRLEVKHTSAEMAGQIYLPRVNMMLLVGVLLVVLLFRSSSNLAAAYGVSVTATMVIDSMMAFVVVWKLWKWPLWKSLALMLPFFLVENVFFTANVIKVLDGGWFPILVGGFIMLVILTWRRGARILMKETRRNEVDLGWLVKQLINKPPHRVPGTAVFLTGDPTAAPSSLMHNLKHNRVLHQRNIIMSFKTADVPRVPNNERIEVKEIAEGFIAVSARFGFMETPSVPKVLSACRKKDLNIDIQATSFFLSRRSIRPREGSEMPGWQERLFISLARSAQDATTYFKIPTDRVVEVGTQVAV